MTTTFKRILLAGALSLATASVFAAPVTYKMDPAHTDVIAQWSHFGYSNPIAHFGNVDGTIVYDADNIAASSVEVTLPMSGMSSHVAKFDEHLRSAELFDVANFPEATFKSSKVESAGEGKLTITGDLTIKGVTRPVVLAATINKVADHPMSKQPSAGFDATASFKRSDFGLGLYAPAVSDEVQIRITTEASVPKAK
ncbi:MULTISPECIES: YceI family protein [unclassified Luteimonas]|uniref:YceI family protein n=1 Tax=unclassified Luteimonas TaxID=2629088 RepID=UPI00160176EA|nr:MULTISPECIES: YceI family protein [unclassified Luteimonas]MBB1473180.1 polyisoprenoid-binding protein [Luteimonas sp. MC1782]MBB6598116.1 polyisoprenoid-binding protein [Luteimonas sp. MC1825]QOC88350.1 polyisoprenoid-binding protein [Luteimonas sp. MC1825]